MTQTHRYVKLLRFFHRVVPRHSNLAFCRSDITKIFRPHRSVTELKADLIDVSAAAKSFRMNATQAIFAHIQRSAPSNALNVAHRLAYRAVSTDISQFTGWRSNMRVLYVIEYSQIETTAGDTR